MSEKILTEEQIQDAKRIAERLHALHHDALALKEATGGAILDVDRYSGEHEVAILVSTVAAFMACAPDALWQFETRKSDLYPITATARLSESYKVELLLDRYKAYNWPAPQPPALVALLGALTR